MEPTIGTDSLLFLLTTLTEHRRVIKGLAETIVGVSFPDEFRKLFG